MTIINKIATGLGVIALAGLSLVGCEKAESSSERIEKSKDYFAEINAVDSRGGVGIVSGDFNEDKHLDIIYGTSMGRLYFFEGDGKGNFKIKKYSEIYSE